ncbi:hypothetical protein BGZ96_010660, partial [Linnemannia gamsii]
MGPSYTAGDLVQEAQPLLSDHDHDHDGDCQHAEGSGPLLPSLARIPKTTSIHEEYLEEESSADGDQPQRGLSEADRLAVLESLPWHRQPSTLWLMPFVFTLAMMLGIALAAQEQQIIAIICKDFLRNNGHPAIGGKDEDVCKHEKIQAFAAVITSHLSSIKNVFCIFTVGYYTSQSDLHGRKFLIYLTLVPGLFSQMLIIYMGRPHSTLGLWPLYVNAIVTGCLGAGSLLEPGLGAYIGIGKAIYDITQENNVVLMVALVTAICLIFYTLALPESRPKEIRIAEASDICTPPTRCSKEPKSFLSKVKQLLKQTLEPLLLFLPGKIKPIDNELPTRYTLLLLVGAYACGQFASNGIMAVFVPYSILVHKWGTSENGSYFIFYGVSTLVVYLVIFPGLQYVYKYFTKTAVSVQPPDKDSGMDFEQVSAMLNEVSTNTGVHVADIAILPTIDPAQGPVDTAKQDASIKMDLSFFVFGSVLYAVGFSIVPLFKTDIILYTACAIHSLGSIGLTAFTSLMTVYVPSHQTGKALGGVAILDAILQALAALLYASIFARTAGSVPSTVYFV